MDDSAKRDTLLLQVLRDVPFDGWNGGVIAAAGARLGLAPGEATTLFPAGARDAVAAFSRWADREMLAALAVQDLAAMKVRERIAAAVHARLAVLEPHREAVRRALALLAMPHNVALSLRLLYATVDAMWYAAGDTATDFNFYSKRGLLAAVYAATTLYWLDDRSPGAADTQAFLERRLGDVMTLPRYGARLRERLDRLPNPLRLLRPARR